MIPNSQYYIITKMGSSGTSWLWLWRLLQFWDQAESLKNLLCVFRGPHEFPLPVAKRIDFL